ncbi:universal stress protein [Streptacidiphilus rugosus]|uniref:universal stress protein n=1 Tax=Streptacidiphilus rugosus TaxID=405783 RepID=UPI00055CBC40|nr:universal stress protein [Streptacidiphilus rugosus]
MPLEQTGAVVVGLDPSAHARAALHWAAKEAALRDSVLRIGHAWSLSAYDLPGPHPLYDAPRARAAAQDFVDRAAAEARAGHPRLKVEALLLDVNAVDGLLHLAESADLLVVGSRGVNAFVKLLLGSVSEGVVAFSPVPTVLVTVEEEPAAAGAPVVVGVGADGAAPLEFAFAAAERRGTRLEAVRALLRPRHLPGYLSIPPIDHRGHDGAERAEVERLVEEAHRAHPAVGFRVRVGPGLPEELLLDASTHASLLVVGGHHRHGRFGPSTGRVAKVAMHMSRAPVAILPRS